MILRSVGSFCQLCQKARASIFCSADNAFLCWSCDESVHMANFLAARHSRLLICSNCKTLTGTRVFHPLLSTLCVDCCRNDDQNVEENHHDLDLGALFSSESDSASSSVSCATSNRKDGADDSRRYHSKFNSSEACDEVTSCPVSLRFRIRSRRTTPIVDSKAERVLVYWCSRLGLTADRAVHLGKNALVMCWNQMSVFPFRVRLAATLWFGFKLCKDKSVYTSQTLKRLEEISGVKATLISAAESKLERTLKFVVVSSCRRRRKDHQVEEGFGES